MVIGFVGQKERIRDARKDRIEDCDETLKSVSFERFLQIGKQDSSDLGR